MHRVQRSQHAARGQTPPCTSAQWLYRALPKWLRIRFRLFGPPGLSFSPALASGGPFVFGLSRGPRFHLFSQSRGLGFGWFSLPASRFHLCWPSRGVKIHLFCLSRGLGFSPLWASRVVVFTCFGLRWGLGFACFGLPWGLRFSPVLACSKP